MMSRSWVVVLATAAIAEDVGSLVSLVEDWSVRLGRAQARRRRVAGDVGSLRSPLRGGDVPELGIDSDTTVVRLDEVRSLILEKRLGEARKLLGEAEANLTVPTVEHERIFAEMEQPVKLKKTPLDMNSDGFLSLGELAFIDDPPSDVEALVDHVDALEFRPVLRLPNATISHRPAIASTLVAALTARATTARNMSHIVHDAKVLHDASRSLRTAFKSLQIHWPTVLDDRRATLEARALDLVSSPEFSIPAS